MSLPVWEKLARSERCVLSGITCDVWLVGGGARFTVIDNTGYYRGAGLVDSIAKAKSNALAIATRTIRAGNFETGGAP